MTRLLSLCFLGFALLFTACPNDDDNGEDVATVEVNFRGEFGGEDLMPVAGRYDYIDGSSKLLLTLFQFYVSDLQLVPTDGGEAITLSEIELVRWNDSSDPVTRSFSYPNVPVGTYSVRFGLGVKPELNAMEPNQFAADFVLNENEYWNENARYVFAKIEGNAELEGDGLFDTPLTYHLGKDDFYVTLDYPGTFDIGLGANNNIDFTVDVERMMAESASVFTDIQDEMSRVIHNPNSPVSAQQWDNLQQAILLVR